MAAVREREQRRLEEKKALPFGIKCGYPVIPRAGDKNKSRTSTQSPVWTSDGAKPDSGQMDWYADTD